MCYDTLSDLTIMCRVLPPIMLLVKPSKIGWDRVHDNSSKDTSSNTTISLQRQLVYYDSLSNATLSLLLFLPTTSGRKISLCIITITLPYEYLALLFWWRTAESREKIWYQ